MEINPAVKKSFYQYLDTYRFIAVFLVIISHWLPSYLEHSMLAKIGVDMFFVLSGFLITENLLIQKSRLRTRRSLGDAFRTFYIRRSLRIFPVYYFVIFFFLVINLTFIKKYFFWFLFYGVNYLIIKIQQWPGMFSHLWSLAVEEQFYIVWPAIVFLVPFKALDKLIYSLIIGSVVFVSATSGKNFFTVLSLPSCICTLSVGAMLAFFKNSKALFFTRLKYDWLVFFMFSLLTIIAVVAGFKFYWLELSIAFFSFCFIKLLITRTNVVLDLLFGNRLTSFLGKISYGLYLYHNFIPWLLRNLNGSEKQIVFIHRSFLPKINNGLVLFVLHWILLLLMAVTSWYSIEKPFNNLKTRFAY